MSKKRYRKKEKLEISHKLNFISLSITFYYKNYFLEYKTIFDPFSEIFDI